VDSLSSLRGRIGAYRLHATHDPRETTGPGRRAFMSRFDDEVDPDRTLPEVERQRRVAMARKAYFARLALASAKARCAKHAATAALIERKGIDLGLALAAEVLRVCSGIDEQGAEL
jgi:hypothetical protein